MHKTIDKCVLAIKERIMLPYPLFRFYADEANAHI